MKQFSFEKIYWAHRFSHGGSLRQKRAGRRARPLSTKEPIHIVLKAHRQVTGTGFRQSQRFALIHQLIRKYSKKFYVKVEEISINSDHLHFVVRASRRSLFQHFLRVLAGQIAQQLEKEGLLKNQILYVTDTPGIHGNSDSQGKVPTKQSQKTKLRLWKYRPFTRVVRGYKAYKTLLSYVRLNEKEARGEIRYKKQRLRDLNPDEWALLWA
jgi:putative transposase